MVMGYPGRTERYLSSWGVQQAINVTSPAVVKIRDKKLAIIKHDMEADAAIRIKYATKYATSSNYWKYFIGQIKGLKHQKVYERKKQSETDFTVWVNANATKTAITRYGAALSDIEASYADAQPFILHRTYMNEVFFQGPEIVYLAYQFRGLNDVLKNKDSKPEDISKAVGKLKGVVEEFFKDYNVATDKKLFAALMDMFYKAVPKEQHAEVLKTVEKKYDGDFDKYGAWLYEKSIFASQEKLNAFLAAPKAKTLGKDPGFIFMSSIYNNYLDNYAPKALPGRPDENAKRQKILSRCQFYVALNLWAGAGLYSCRCRTL